MSNRAPVPSPDTERCFELVPEPEPISYEDLTPGATYLGIGGYVAPVGLLEKTENDIYTFTGLQPGSVDRGFCLVTENRRLTTVKSWRSRQGHFTPTKLLLPPKGALNIPTIDWLAMGEIAYLTGEIERVETLAAELKGTLVYKETLEGLYSQLDSINALIRAA